MESVVKLAVDNPVEDFLGGLLSDETREVYRRTLRAFGDFLGGRSLVSARRSDVEAYRNHLEAKGRAPATQCKEVSAICGFYAWAFDEGLTSRPIGRVRRPRVSDVSPRRAMTAGEVQRLFEACDTGLMGLRDRAMLGMMAVQGWRVSEVLGLQVEDLDEEMGHLVANVRGKGGKHVRVPLAAVVHSAIVDWCAAAGIADGPVFRGLGRGYELSAQAIGRRAAWQRIQRLAKQAGLLQKIHPHVLRHTCVTEALAGGVPLHKVQDHARHADPRTTRRYDSHRQALSNPAPHVLADRLVPERLAEGG